MMTHETQEQILPQDNYRIQALAICAAVWMDQAAIYKKFATEIDTCTYEDLGALRAQFFADIVIQLPGNRRGPFDKTKVMAIATAFLMTPPNVWNHGKAVTEERLARMREAAAQQIDQLRREKDAK